MIALQIQDKKKMLQVLLESASFDTFLMQEVSVIRDSSLFLEGRIHPEYHPQKDQSTQKESPDFVPWHNIRTLLASYIGKEFPLSFKFVLQAPAAYTQNLLKNAAFTGDPSTVKGLILTFRYEQEHLTCLTGISLTTFSMDKSIETLWDQGIKKALANMQIGFEE